MADLPIDIQKKIDILIDKAYEYFQKGNINESLNNCYKAFDLILEPKNQYGESFHITKSILRRYITIKDKDKAYEKIKDLEKYYGLRYDSGELELIKGKTFFEFEDYNEALQYFDIAFKKSKGCEFQGEDRKYLDFYRNPEKYMKSHNVGILEQKSQEELSKSHDVGILEQKSQEELSDELYDSIVLDLEKGDEAFEKSKFQDALNYYLQGLEKIPVDKHEWEISLHVFTALGDCYFNLEDFVNSNHSYNQALQCPDGLGHGYVWLGLGRSFFELEEKEKAKDAFMRAYMLEGKEIFDDQGDEYFDLIKSLVE